MEVVTPLECTSGVVPGLGKRDPCDYVHAIIARDQGLPYSVVLDRHEITCNQFYRAVTAALPRLIGVARNRTRSLLAILFRDDARRRELLSMDKRFLREQYDRIRTGGQGQFCWGTFSHPDNVKILVHYALTRSHPEMASPARATVINCIRSLPLNLAEHFEQIGLAGLMRRAFGRGQRGSPLAVLEVFDTAYRERTGEASLFDLGRPDHLHRWGDMFRAPNSYWKEPANVQEAVYHTLVESCPRLGSTARSEVIRAVKGLPPNLQKWFWQHRLSGLMDAFGNGRHNSPWAILEVFDGMCRKETGSASLFDGAQSDHLAFGRRNRLIR
jgi:hypothetical protein